MNRESIYTVPYSTVPYGSKIILYGAGKMGQNYYQSIKQSGRLQVVAIIDAKAYRLLNIWADVPVVEPSMVSGLEYDYILIAVEKKAMAEEIRGQLRKYGVNDEKIVWGGECQELNSEAANEVHKFIKRTLSGKKKRFFIFMLPEHGNTGDYAIGYAELCFLKRYFSQYEVYDITTTEWIKAKEFFIDLIHEQDVVFFNGGGYWGDLRGDDVIYKDIIECFPKNKKIFFPNNLTYKREPSTENTVFMKDIDWLMKQKEMYIFLREKRSYDLLKKYFSNCYLFPDMVFLLHYERVGWGERKRVLLCMRNDCEKSFKQDKKLEEILLNRNFEYDRFDIYTGTYFSQEMGKNLLKYVLKKFQSYECIITDRLHGMILSVIANVPCVALDNYTHKISGVYEWIKDMGYAYLMEESQIEEIEEIIEKVCMEKRIVGDYHPQVMEFDNMAEKLQEIIDI